MKKSAHFGALPDIHAKNGRNNLFQSTTAMMDDRDQTYMHDESHEVLNTDDGPKKAIAEHQEQQKKAI